MSAPDARRVALVEDDEDLRAATAQMLSLAGFAVLPLADARAALEAIDADFAGVVVSDVRMPMVSGIELFRSLRARDADLPVILVTGHGDVPMAVEALHQGAWDFLTKPFDPQQLIASVTRAAGMRAVALENRRLRRLAAQPGSASPLVGRSPAIERLRDTIAVLADAQIDVLVEGETGVGKELVARLIHRGGRRARHGFSVVACSALPDALIDAELLGAGGAGVGRVQQAHRGTLVLDDVDQASPALQARLVQIAEERAVRVPGREPAPLDLRIVATAAEIADPRDPSFSAALFHRLAGVRLRVPPLRERLGDVPMLFAYLLEDSAARVRRPVPRLDEAVLQRLRTHDWPGNVRELAHFADRVVLGLEQDTSPPSDADVPAALPDLVAAFERQAICDALAAAGGDASAAMARLQLPRKTFYYKIQRHGIDLSTYRRREGS